MAFVLKSLCCVGVLAISTVSFAANSAVDSVKAPFYVDKEVMVCGQVHQVVTQKKRVLYNLGDAYPREHVAIQIWNSDLPEFVKKFGAPENLAHKRVCVHGKIETYKEHLFITVKNPTLFRLMLQ